MRGARSLERLWRTERGFNKMAPCCMLDSALKEEFQHGKQDIVDRLNEHLGRPVVKRVRIL